MLCRGKVKVKRDCKSRVDLDGATDAAKALAASSAEAEFCPVISYQLSINHHERPPVGAFLVLAAICGQHVLHQKWHRVDEADRIFFGVGKS